MKQLRQIRQQRGMTIWQVSQSLGISPQVYQYMEAKSKRIEVSTLYALCKAFNCRISDIIPDDVDNASKT